MCKLISYVVPENPFAATSRAIGTSKCLTHDWDFGFGYPVGENTLCPLGRIEKAVEDGLAKLATAGFGANTLGQLGPCEQATLTVADLPDA